MFAKLIENYNSYRGLEESLEAPTRTVYEVVEYEYNERDEMVLERTTDMAGIQQAIQYLYNIHGDRIEVSQGQLSKLYSYNTKGQLSQMNNGSNTTYYHYNSRGDVVREVRGGSEKTYSYDERNKLMTVSDYNGTSITYSYDGLGD